MIVRLIREAPNILSNIIPEAIQLVRARVYISN